MKEALKRVRKYIERGWCQKTLARTADGEPCSTGSELATSWCLVGACIAAGVYDYHLSGFLTRRTGGDSIPNWNDEFGRTQKDVLAFIDDAIEAAP